MKNLSEHPCKYSSPATATPRHNKGVGLFETFSPSEDLDIFKLSAIIISKAKVHVKNAYHALYLKVVRDSEDDQCPSVK